MDRSQLLQQLSSESQWDVIIIGGGATGLGIAMDAATRQYKTLLVEQADFAKGTSSKATKLVHGGVRYMAQGDLGLVREACHERGLLLKNAPHLTKNETFIIPNYSWFNNIKYTLGLKFYDMLAGKLSLGASKYISKKHTIEALPTIRQEGLKGGVLYHDGQFDDSRLALNIAQTAIENGATVLNYMKVESLIKDNNKKVVGIISKDIETGITYKAVGKVVINATGVYVDNILHMDRPDAPHMVRPSQGVHITLSRSFLPGENALMIPETDDGRVLFAVPWHDKLIVGTTDTIRDHPELEPHALDKEIEFILSTAGKYLVKKPLRSDVQAVFAGLRPLAAPAKEGAKTKEISRSHKIIISDSGLITITGGKWTTFRRMAQDTVQKAIEKGFIPNKTCVTEHLHIHGYSGIDHKDPLHFYGSDLAEIQKLIAANPALGEKLLPQYPYTKALVVWAVKNEYARHVEDVLGRRFRLLFLDARAAVSAAPEVARIMADELGRDAGWIQNEINDFTQLAKGYTLI
ncbi:glycerol-3-phosphate dehydrogenase [Chitinophaga sp. CF118]|uniref:glycerol-3-phosphate dehydrogenase/oxidase n=1 Tax=Chitinophaga sp. CF118 TaxID=1884367 RepID=UPI0008F05DDB|nr:glycerol-3-phosphate dehydrogenase/oxidase [Chitinophaga sp. CF118]SFD48738.1 glycerol-3-phosphate dehydrogenase [Chitinophaga sp. CF118]